MAQVDATHPGLGPLVAMELVCAKAGKCLLVVASAGSGKSVALEAVAQVVPGAIYKDSMTRSSLRNYQEEFNGFHGLICCDDVGKIDTEWSQQQFLVTMAELCYGHFVSKDSLGIKVEIEDFKGACILNIQPPVLAPVVTKPTWHSNLGDKTIRYYHLRRATIPSMEKPHVEVDWGYPLDAVSLLLPTGPEWGACLSIGREQWTEPRTIEHCRDLARALAAFRRDEAVSTDDLRLLWELMQPLAVEMEVMERDGFESKAKLDVNMYYLLVEFLTHETVTPAQIAADYHMHVRSVNRILESMIDYYYVASSDPRTIAPTPLMRQILQKVRPR